jgi:hypothetical protein
MPTKQLTPLQTETLSSLRYKPQPAENFNLNSVTALRRHGLIEFTDSAEDKVAITDAGRTALETREFEYVPQQRDTASERPPNARDLRDIQREALLMLDQHRLVDTPVNPTAILTATRHWLLRYGLAQFTSDRGQIAITDAGTQALVNDYYIPVDVAPAVFPEELAPPAADPVPSNGAHCEPEAAAACDTCVYRQAFDMAVRRHPDLSELVMALRVMEEWQ